MTGGYITQQIVNGLILGSMYALVAIGFTMIYGIIRLINFAHGDVVMIGAFLTLGLLQILGWPFWLVSLCVRARLSECLLKGPLSGPCAAPLRSRASSRRSPCPS